MVFVRVVYLSLTRENFSDAPICLVKGGDRVKNSGQGRGPGMISNRDPATVADDGIDVNTPRLTRLVG